MGGVLPRWLVPPRWLVSLGIAVGLATFTCDAKADRILRRAAQPIDGVEVTLEDYREVRHRRASGPEQTIEASKVAAIEYDDTPAAYTEAVSALAQGNYENAIATFKLAAQQKTKHDWVKEYAALGTAQALKRWAGTQKSRYADAIAAYKAFTKDYPKSRFYAEAQFDLGECESLSGSLEAAVKTFDTLREWAFNERIGVELEIKALDAIADAYLANAKASEARAAFNRVGSFATAQAEKAKDDLLKALLRGYAERASLKEGEILLLERKYPEAERFFEKLLNDASLAPDVRAAGLNGIGECQFAQSDYKKAQLSFARARVIYFNEKVQAAKATYFLGKCALALGDREPDGPSRAREYFTEVVERFPNTEWAAKARGELK
ncbi:MAG: tetratricopeptide repeat protein [Planctomycetota bacterium]